MTHRYFKGGLLNSAIEFVDKYRDCGISIVYHDELPVIKFVTPRYDVIIYDENMCNTSDFFKVSVFETKTETVLCSYGRIKGVSIIEDGFLKLYDNDFKLSGIINLIPGCNLTEEQTLKNIINKLEAK